MRTIKGPAIFEARGNPQARQRRDDFAAAATDDAANRKLLGVGTHGS